MRRIVACVLLFVVAVPGGGAPAPLPKSSRIDRKSDLDRLQGEWRLVCSADHKGRISTVNYKFDLVITGGQCTFKLDGVESTQSPYWITLDLTSTPKKMTLVPRSDQNTEGNKVALTIPYVYRIQGNVLTMRNVTGSPGCLTDFTSPPKLNSSDPDVRTYHRQ